MVLSSNVNYKPYNFLPGALCKYHFTFLSSLGNALLSLESESVEIYDRKIDVCKRLVEKGDYEYIKFIVYIFAQGKHTKTSNQPWSFTIHIRRQLKIGRKKIGGNQIA